MLSENPKKHRLDFNFLLKGGWPQLDDGEEHLLGSIIIVLMHHLFPTALLLTRLSAFLWHPKNVFYDLLPVFHVSMHPAKHSKGYLTQMSKATFVYNVSARIKWCYFIDWHSSLNTSSICIVFPLHSSLKIYSSIVSYLFLVKLCTIFTFEKVKSSQVQSYSLHLSKSCQHHSIICFATERKLSFFYQCGRLGLSSQSWLQRIQPRLL